MALFKTRPNVRLQLRRALVSGALAEFVVTLDCPAPLPVDAVSLTLTGEVVWFTSSQYGRHRNASRFLALDVPLLSDKTELDAGVHELTTRVSLSPDLPGSWKGDRLAIEYGVKIHVDIPWWPDKRVAFVVSVASKASAPSTSERPTVFVSHMSGPPARGPYLELSLGQRSIKPGATMRLSAALGNVELNRYRKLHVALIARESFPIGLGGAFTNDHTVSRWSVDIEGHPGELQPIPFSLGLPHNLAPAFSMHDCELSWLLQVHADVAWGNDPKLRVPVEVAALEATSEQGQSAPLAVGSERLRLIWSSVARATELEFVDGRLRGVVDGVELELQREQIGGRTMVVGLLEFSPLGVDLQTQLERRGLLGSSEAALTCRDEIQGAIIGARLGPLLSRAKVELLDASDTRLRLANDNTGLDHEPLVGFAGTLAALATALSELPEHLPAPASMAEHGATWRETAKTMRAELRPGDLQLSLARGDSTVRVRSEFDGEGIVHVTSVELDPGQRIPSRHHLFWSSDNALPESELPLDAVLEMPSWAAQPRVGLEINAEVVRVSLPAPLPDPQLERDRVEALFALGRRLRGEQGPYR